jgi:predicted nuclease of predicted toxin-antitoxin system
MRFLVDECTGPAVARWLREQTHEVFSVFDEARGTADDEILEKAHSENWILITNDNDFGEKVFRERQPHRGVVFLRLKSRSDSLHRKLHSRTSHRLERAQPSSKPWFKEPEPSS